MKLGGNIIKIGYGEIELKTGKNGDRDYVDISDNSAFTVTFPTTLGGLHVRIYQDIKNYNKIQVEVENKGLWNELQKTGESIGQGCLFGGMPVREAVASGGFLRSGRFCDQKPTETIKLLENSETVSWVDRLKDKEAKQSTTSRAIH